MTNQRVGDSHASPTAHPVAPRTNRWEPFWHDVRYAARGLRRKPGFTTAVALTLGLGIGANATMFSIVDRLLFRVPAYLAVPDRVHRLNLGEMTESDGEFITGTMSYKRYVELTAWTSTLDRTAVFTGATLALGVGEAAREMPVAAVSSTFWGLFDMTPVIGRFFTAEEDRPPDGTFVGVLSYGYWQSSFGGRNDVIGSTLNVGSRTYTIIGVAPKDFAGVSLTTPALYVPITAYGGSQFSQRGDRPFGGGRRPNYHDAHNIRWLEMLGRRKPGVTLEAATADLTNAFLRSRIAQESVSPNMRPTAFVKPRVIVSPIMRERGPNQGNDTKVTTWLVGVAAIVLLIACANVGNLLLARAFSRRREIAVRLALGVGRGRLLRQLMTESVMVAGLGAVAGLALAHWGGGVLRAALLQNVAWPSTFGDLRVLGFTLLATLVAGLLTGLAPALHAGRGDIAGTLKAGAREGTYQRSRTRIALLITQGALSVVLLVGAGLFVRSLRNVRTLDLGYDVNRIAYTEIKMRGVRLDSTASDALRERLVDAARALPYVESAARTITVPFWMSMNQDLYVAGIDSVSRLGDFLYNGVSPEYFQTVGTSIRRGRGFTSSDSRDAPRVMVVSESMARKLWPSRDALGQCVRIGADTAPCTSVVGVAKDQRLEKLSANEGLQYYVPIDQEQRGSGGGLFVRTRGDANTWTEALRRELQRSMPGVSYVSVTPLEDILGPQTRSWTLGATMFTVFGVLALLVAAVGLYSVIAYNVAQRMHELGVRIALGARSPDVVRLVVGEGMRVSLIGVGIGSMAAFAAARYVGPLLFDVSPRDPVVYTSVVLVLVAVALLASLVPAWRASRVDPSVALRAD